MSAAMIAAFLAQRALRPPAVPQRRLRVRAADGVESVVGVFEPPAGTPATDVLLFLHGAGAHMGAGYLDLAGALHERCGAAVLVPDLRGHGRSGGPRGEVAQAESLWGDVDLFVRQALQRYPQARLHLGGHSLGASLCVNWMTRVRPPAAHALRSRVHSLLLLAPYTGLRAVDRPAAGAPFLRRGGPGGTPGEVHFDYPAELAAVAGLVCRYNATLFDALAPPGFLAQLAQVRLAHGVPATVLVARDDELFDAAALRDVLAPVARLHGASRGQLMPAVVQVPGGHLTCLYFAADALAAALADSTPDSTAAAITARGASPIPEDHHAPTLP